MADYLNIAGRIRTTASDGVAMEAQEVKDLNLNKSQQEVNADVQTELVNRYTKEETYNRDQLNELITTPDVNHVSVVATDATTAVTDILPATGEANTIYRVGKWNGTQYDPTMYALFAWNGTTYVCLAVRSFVGEVYDISVNHPDGQGNPTPYADLAAALGTNGANIPADIRRGGMSIKFIQGSVSGSDNKYVQFRYMGTSTATADFTNADNWQGVDDEPVAGSDNLVKSGGVESDINTKVYGFGQTVKSVPIEVVSMRHISFPFEAMGIYTIKNNSSSSIDLYLRQQMNSTGQKSLQIAAGASRTIQESTGYNYLYYYKPSAPGEIANIEIKRSGNLSDTVTEIASAVEDTQNEVDVINNNIIKNAAYTLKGRSSSIVKLKTPILLSQNGDEIEISVNTQQTGDYYYAFTHPSEQVTSYTQAIAICKNNVGIRATDGTWLMRKNLVSDGNVLFKLIYSNSKMTCYVNGELFTEIDGLYNISIDRFGDGGGGTYGYWEGTINYVKYNGQEILKPANVIATDVDTTINYKFDTQPSGILELHYDENSPYFEFFSRNGSKNEYYSFIVGLDVDNSNEVYLKEWRLKGGAKYTYVNNRFFKIADSIYNAENEMAIKFGGTVDWTGGVHGDERIDIDNTCFAKFFADGKLLTDLTADFSIECKNFCYIQKSTLHQTGSSSQPYIEGHPIIAYHYKRNSFENCGSKLENIIEMLTAQSVTGCHAGLMCIAKTAGTYAILPNMVVTQELTGTRTEISADNMKMSNVDIWNPTKSIRCAISCRFIEGYDDQTEIDQFILWDRNTDTKYYRRKVNGSKAFAIGDIIINEQKVSFS